MFKLNQLGRKIWLDSNHAETSDNTEKSYQTPNSSKHNIDVIWSCVYAMLNHLTKINRVLQKFKVQVVLQNICIIFNFT